MSFSYRTNVEVGCSSGRFHDVRHIETAFRAKVDSRPDFMMYRSRTTQTCRNDKINADTGVKYC